MSASQDEAASRAAKLLARARWGDTVLRRAAATVLERGAGLADTTRADLEQIAGDPARDGDDAA
jgi:hypothetical protein